MLKFSMTGYKHKEGRACTALIYLDHSYTLDLKASQIASNPALLRKLYWRECKNYPKITV